MPSRRRFSRGYCPLRRASVDIQSVVGPDDDDYYTTTLQLQSSSLASAHGKKEERANHELHEQQQEGDEGDTSSSSDESPHVDVFRSKKHLVVDEQKARGGGLVIMRRRRRKSASAHHRASHAYVTSLSWEDGKASVPVAAVETVVLNDSLLRLEDADDDVSQEQHSSSFLAFRVNYLIVTVAIMLADGLQGTHLYALYDGYGVSVASLYCLGFVTGAVTCPITNPLVDRIGRKKAALIYCILEIAINQLEQYNMLWGLVISRVVGGVTTNLLSSVFETWLDAEYRKRGFCPSNYELVMRDSVVASNLAAIASGYLAHELAEFRGLKGPFEGAVACTGIACLTVAFLWTENYGHISTCNDSGDVSSGKKSTWRQVVEVINIFRADSKLLRVGIIQGCTAGSLQIFIFLWSPALAQLAHHASAVSPPFWGLDSHGEPAYGLIFGAFMFAGVLGGIASSSIRKGVTALLSPLASTDVEVEGEGKVRPMAVEFLAAFCYLICSLLLLTPCVVSDRSSTSFLILLAAFVLYEWVVGVYMPCEGVIRSLYIPPTSRGTLLTLPRIIVNIAVALGVASTNFISLRMAFSVISVLMAISAVLQLSLVSSREWRSLFGRVDRMKRRASRRLSSMLVTDDHDTKIKLE